MPIIRTFIALSLVILFFISCQPPTYNPDSIPNEEKINKKAVTPKEKPQLKQTAFKIYLENSGSMDGYLTGETAYKNTVLQLASDIFQQGYTTKYFIVNQEIIDINKQIKNFQDLSYFINSSQIKQYGNTKSTEINKIIEMVVHDFKSNDEVAIVFSDFIYSVQGDVLNSLSTNRYATKVLLKETVDKDKALLMIRLSSQFKGNYYDMKHPNQGNLIVEKRPVFAMVIGPQLAINNFENDFRINELPGFVNAVEFVPTKTIAKPVFYSILNRTNKKGNFFKTNRNSSVIHEISDISVDRADKQFQFSVAIDLSLLPYGYDLLNKNNYFVQSNINDQFKIVSVVKIDKIDPNDRRYQGTSTHIITLSATKLTIENQVLTIGLKTHLPEWKDWVSTLDDTTPQGRLDKTFGINYLLDGIAEAFGYRSGTNFFKISLTLKK